MTMNAHKIKQDICEIGRRLYNKGFAAANDGNITVRISDNEVLCTPTMHSKGFLKVEDICTIDMTGKQIAGIKKRSSEALLHLEIYKQRPDIKSVVHCHPPHATAFAVAREPIPQCMLPEVEVFLGDVPITANQQLRSLVFADVDVVEHRLELRGIHTWTHVDISGERVAHLHSLDLCEEPLEEGVCHAVLHNDTTRGRAPLPG